MTLGSNGASVLDKLYSYIYRILSENPRSAFDILGKGIGDININI